LFSLFFFQIGKRVGQELNQQLVERLEEEEKKGLKRKTVGFLR
jgi:hypothetical protein